MQPEVVLLSRTRNSAASSAVRVGVAASPHGGAVRRDRRVGSAARGSGGGVGPGNPGGRGGGLAMVLGRTSCGCRQSETERDQRDSGWESASKAALVQMGSVVQIQLGVEQRHGGLTVSEGLVLRRGNRRRGDGWSL